MRRATFLSVFLLVGVAFPLAAQTQSGASTPALRTGAQVLTFTKKEDLRQIPVNAKIIALDMTLKDIGKDEKEVLDNAKPLLDWAQNGGVVWLHTDAARLFGFTTVPLQSAVELIGKAKPVVPWHAHPLTQGVRKIFYTLHRSSALVTGHPRGMMLMRVADSPVQRAQPSFVCAEASFGNGTALFVPPEVSQPRAEGLTFLNNLQKFSAGEPMTYRVPGAELEKALSQWQMAARERNLADAKKPLSVVAAYVHLWMGEMLYARSGKSKEALAELEKAANANNQIAEVYAALSEVYAATDDKDKADLAKKRAEELAKSERTNVPDRSGVGLLLTEGELKQLVDWVDAVAGGSAERRAALGAFVTTLAGRIFYQASFNPISRAFDLTNAERTFALALQQEPTSRHALFWMGALRATQGFQAQLASPQRIQRFGDAIRLWQEFTLARGGAQGEPENNAFPPSDQLSSWTKGIGLEMERLNMEPPSVQVAPGGLIVRFAPTSDTGWRESVNLLQSVISSAATSVGLRVEEPELLIFPTLASFEQYRLLTKRAVPEFGPTVTVDVAGERILLVAQQNQGIISVAQRGENRRLLAHQYGHVVVNAWTEGVRDVPAWLAEGVARNLEGAGDPRPLLRQARQQGVLLNWSDLLVAPPQLPDLFYAQSQAMVAFLVRAGQPRGGVLRMTQLIGMGVSPDVAIEEVTGLTPDRFMVAWAQAEFR